MGPRNPRHLRKNFDPHQNLMNSYHPHQNLTDTTHEPTRPRYPLYPHNLADPVLQQAHSEFWHI